MAPRILVTGGTGFIGGRLLPTLLAEGMPVRCAVRRETRIDSVSDVIAVGDIGPSTDWRSAVSGIDVVVHIAGLSHVGASAPAGAHHLVNAEGTRALAEAAAQAGVRRLVFLSTIHVNGQHSGARAFTEDDPPAPRSPYAESKLAGERHVSEIAGRSGMEWCIVRVPLVYGPGARGNFPRLVGLVAKGVPLPLAAAVAKKSFISVENLASLLALTITHPGAVNALCLASDGEDVSTADLVRTIAAALGKRARLLYVPEGLLRALAAVLGRTEDAERLFDPLQIDSSRVRARLGWQPPLGFEEAIRHSVLASAAGAARPSAVTARPAGPHPRP